MNELIQRFRNQHDKLMLDRGIIFHEWSLRKESGKKQTAVENIAPDFGVVEKRTESRVMYYTLAAVMVLIALLSHPESLLGTQGRWIALILAFVFLFAGIFRNDKRYIDVIYTKEGKLFAVIRRDWVDRESKDRFLRALKDATANSPPQPENQSR